MTITIALPATYADDALSRDLDIGVVTFQGKKQVVMTCTPAQLQELKSDASYYTSEGPYMSEWGQCVGRSAKRALVKINKALDDL